MNAKVLSAGIIGMDTYEVEVQVDISYGVQKFDIVGLAESSVKEGRTRIDSALRNSGYAFRGTKINVNLSPAGIRKEGVLYDLPIAVGILTAKGVVKPNSNGGVVIAGELSLDGKVRPIKGALLIASKVKEMGIGGLILAKENLPEVKSIDGISAYGVSSLDETVRFLNGEIKINESPPSSQYINDTEHSSEDDIDFADVRGQESAKRAIMIAVAGGHNIMMAGPPGSGKTMLARRVPTILPEMSYDERLETTKVYSILGLIPKGFGLLARRPFRSPHHTVSDAGMIGGNRVPRPGEISLANNGVLFLDEFSEFKKNVLEVMRQPLEDGKVLISRAMGSFYFPARVMLVAAMNPCPCGWLGDREKTCECSSQALTRHMQKISSPIYDRIDIHMEVPRVNFKSLTGLHAGQSSKEMREIVSGAIKIQKKRFSGTKTLFNAQMNESQLRNFSRLDEEELSLLETAMKKFAFSARGYAKILKVARTIADIEESTSIKTRHLAEAIHYRALDRRNKF
jgi:magnesium chelatase family protein